MKSAVLVSASVAAANTDYMAIIEGLCEASANGSLQLRCRSEVNGSQITIKNSGHLIASKFHYRVKMFVSIKSDGRGIAFKVVEIPLWAKTGL